MYKLIRSILFLADPEKVHYFSMNLLKAACSVPMLRSLISSMYSPAKGTLPKTFAGLRFKNPVGLGAGFDKNALYLRELEALGFGFVEIGTVTPIPQQGNEKPRLFRLPADKALINRMGFNNDGMEVIAERLKKWRMASGYWEMGSDELKNNQQETNYEQRQTTNDQQPTRNEKRETTNDQRPTRNEKRETTNDQRETRNDLRN